MQGQPGCPLYTALGGCVRICTPQASTTHPQVPHGLGYKYGGPRALGSLWGAAAERGGCGQPPEALQGLRASGPWSAALVTASLFSRSRGASWDSRASVLLQGHSPTPLASPKTLGSWSLLRSLAPLLQPAPQGTLGHGSPGPSPTLCPSSSGARSSLSAARSPHLHRWLALRPSWHRHGGAGQRGGAGWRLGVSGR